MIPLTQHTYTHHYTHTPPHPRSFRKEEAVSSSALAQLWHPLCALGIARHRSCSVPDQARVPATVCRRTCPTQSTCTITPIRGPSTRLPAAATSSPARPVMETLHWALASTSRQSLRSRQTLRCCATTIILMLYPAARSKLTFASMQTRSTTRAATAG